MIAPKVARELRRAIANHRYEETPIGILFPQAKVYAGGLFETRLNGGPWWAHPNLLPTQGLNALLDIALGAVSKETNWYIAPFNANVAPTSTLTAANFTSTQTEFTNYTEATRALWTPASASSGSVNNTASPVSITIGSGAQNDIYGLALISASAKSATTGKLAACTLLKDSDGDPKPRLDLVEGDELGLRYSISLTSS
jgi:hypothetical protein